MPGKPAARVGDMTAHGGSIVGPGIPTVLIGKMPASTMGDQHVCPMTNPGPVPHVGGPIVLGSTGVLIGKKPAARVGDMCVCVGPPATVAMGCPTVMIGEIMAGSQAGSAASAASAKQAKTTAPTEIQDFPVEEREVEVIENHMIDIQFEDAAGNPVSNAFYTLTDPNDLEIKGKPDITGLAHYEGYVEAGNYDVVVQSISNCQIGSDPVVQGESTTISADCTGFEDGTETTVTLMLKYNIDKLIMADQVLATISGDRIEVDWTLTAEHIEELFGDTFCEVNGIYAIFCEGPCLDITPTVPVTSHYKVTLKGPTEDVVPDQKVKVSFGNNSFVETTSDSNGLIEINDVPPGKAKIELVKDNGQ